MREVATKALLALGRFYRRAFRLRGKFSNAGLVFPDFMLDVFKTGKTIPLRVLIVGPISVSQVAFCCLVAEEVFGMKCEIVKNSLDVSEMLFYEDLDYVNADRLLEHVYAPPYIEDEHKLLAIVTSPLKAQGEDRPYDLYGYAALNWGVAVVSTYSFGLMKRKDLYDGLAKVVVHEIGHAFGVKHCPEEFCVMNKVQQAGGISELSHTFCPSCLEKLRSPRQEQ